MCHLDHLLQLPWADHPRVPPTEAARFKHIYKNELDCGASKDFKVRGVETVSAPLSTAPSFVNTARLATYAHHCGGRTIA